MSAEPESRPLPTDITDEEVAYLRNLLWRTICQATSADTARSTAETWARWEERIRESPRIRKEAP